jgi:hypothetical protein
MTIRHRLTIALGAAAIVGISGGAIANDITPVKAPPRAMVQQSSSGAYFWADGLYERVKLSPYSLGLAHNNSFPTAAGFLNLGPTQTHNPILNGGGVRAAIGYGTPGTTTRIEFGGSYIDASGTEVSSIASAPGFMGQLMSGAGLGTAFNCTAPFSCPTSGVLGTDYRAWSFNGKAETDWRFGSVTATPSITIFGGNTRADQTLSQAWSQFNGAGALVNTASYSADTKLEWRDLGARAGLHLSSAVTPTFTVGWGGWVGAAARSVKFLGNDVSNSNNPGGIIVGSSTLTLDDSKTVFLANAEANVIWHLTPTMSLTGFVGVNYDGDVPGIAGPSFVNAAGGILVSPSAASLIYDNQTSFYAGGGLVVKFGP